MNLKHVKTVIAKFGVPEDIAWYYGEGEYYTEWRELFISVKFRYSSVVYVRIAKIGTGEVVTAGWATMKGMLTPQPMAADLVEKALRLLREPGLSGWIVRTIREISLGEDPRDYGMMVEGDVENFEIWCEFQRVAEEDLLRRVEFQ